MRRNITEPCRQASHFELPDTPPVQKLVAHHGSNLTLHDVALDILSRLMVLPGTDIDELLFLRECLKEGSKRTSLPFFVASGNGERVKAFMELYDGSQKPTVCPSDRWPSRESSHASWCSLLDAISTQSSEPCARWPVPVQLGTALMGSLTPLLETFDTWGFDVFALAEYTKQQSLVFATWEALSREDHFSEFILQPTVVLSFLQRLESRYASSDVVPYHNDIHAADVTQNAHALIVEIGLKDYLGRLGSLSLLIAAAVHDVGHDGRTNSFHVSTGDDLALTYNDSSVLENYHLATAFRLLSEDCSNMFSHFSREAMTSVRKMMIKAVLGTDMACHFEQVNSLKQLHSTYRSDAMAWEDDRIARDELVVLALHAADISGPTKPVPLADKWVNLLREEFWRQGDEEVRQQMTVSALCDRHAGNLAKSQLSFIEFIVEPTYVLLGQIAPRATTVILPRLQENLDVWRLRQKEEDEKADKKDG